MLGKQLVAYVAANLVNCRYIEGHNFYAGKFNQLK